MYALTKLLHCLLFYSVCIFSYLLALWFFYEVLAMCRRSLHHHGSSSRLGGIGPVKLSGPNGALDLSSTDWTYKHIGHSIMDSKGKTCICIILQWPLQNGYQTTLTN